MKKVLCIAGLVFAGLLFFIQDAEAQQYNQGLGIRIGDPFGISYKAYLQRRMAVELILGTVSRNNHSSYYRDTFGNLDKYDDFLYSSHDVKFTMVMMGRYMFHESFPANVEGRLDWFYGAGLQFRYSTVEYQYFDSQSRIFRDDHSNFDFGPEAILGMEYELQDFPMVAFGEISLLMELVDRPFSFRVFGAFGVRYAF
jgi:hypothetical protein